MAKHVLLPLVMAAVLAFAASACGGGRGEEEAKVRPLPKETQALSPGTYSSVEFRPSLTFEVGEGWMSSPPEASDNLNIARVEKTAGLGFAVIEDVYEPTGTSAPKVGEAPEDWFAWFRRHPNLRTGEPEPVEVGGVEGVQFDVEVRELQVDHFGVCGRGCVDIARVSTTPTLRIYEGDKVRVIDLEDVDGRAVSGSFGSSSEDFDDFALQAQKVLDTVEWTGK